MGKFSDFELVFFVCSANPTHEGSAPKSAFEAMKAKCPMFKFGRRCGGRLIVKGK